MPVCFVWIREKFFHEVNSTQQQRSSVPLTKTKALVKSLINRSELLLHVTIAPQCKSLSTTPTCTPGDSHVHLHMHTPAKTYTCAQRPFELLLAACKSVSDTKSHPIVKQPVFLRSMSAPSDLEMIANSDVEFTHGAQRYLRLSRSTESRLKNEYMHTCKHTSLEFYVNAPSIYGAGQPQIA